MESLRLKTEDCDEISKLNGECYQKITDLGRQLIKFHDGNNERDKIINQLSFEVADKENRIVILMKDMETREKQLSNQIVEIQTLHSAEGILKAELVSFLHLY